MIPAHVGPCEFGHLGKLIAVRCPREFDVLMRNAGGQWEAGSRRWLIERHRIGPVIRTLQRRTDPLFRRAGLNLDHDVGAIFVGLAAVPGTSAVGLAGVAIPKPAMPTGYADG